MKENNKEENLFFEELTSNNHVSLHSLACKPEQGEEDDEQPEKKS